MKKTLVLLLVSVLILNTLSISVFATIYDYEVHLNVERTFSISDKDGNKITTNKVEINNLDPTKNTVDINYMVSFDPIEKTAVSIDSPPKEVVLVLDRSGSMAWDLAGHSSGSQYVGPSRMNILKSAATTFVDKLSENSDLKLSLISYSSSSTIHEIGGKKLIDISNGNDSSNSEAYDNKEAIKDAINSMNASGGTNVGDSMRKGYQLIETTASDSLADKYFVFLSDGEPSFYSYETITSNRPDDIYRINSGSNEYYYQGTNSNPNTNNGNDYAKGTKYAELMAPELNIFNKSYFLAFNMNTQNELENIAQIVNSQYFKQAETAEEINHVYDEISKEILAELNLTKVSFSDILPDGLTLDQTDPSFDTSKFTVEGQKFTYSIDSVNYRLNEARTHYIADPIEFKVKVNYGEVGTYNFPGLNGKFVYTDVDGSEKTKNFTEDVLIVERNPVKNVTATRPQDAGNNPNNEVLLSWDTYAGAKSYKVYKVVNGVDVEVGTVTSEKTNLIVPITTIDGPETTYKVEAVLTNDKLSGKGEAKGNTIPSILNLTVARENDNFIVSWDQIDDDTNVKYNITPIINGTSLTRIDDKVNMTDSDVFDIFNKRVTYKYALQNPDSFNYDAEIKFTVDGIKKDKTTNLDIDVVEAVSEPLKIKQYVKTVIETDPTFVYGKNTSVEVDVLSETPFPTGVNLYDPIIVVELVLPVETSLTPLEFTYPTIEVNNVVGNSESTVGTTITSSREGDVKLYIQLNDYKNTFLTPGQNMKLHLDYSIAYESSNGLLKSSIFGYLRNLYPDLKVYEIENKFTNLLDYHYVADINKLVVMNTYIMYNTTSKEIDDPTTRDVTVGGSTRFLKFTNQTEILDEF